jgi:hypothetical protein
LSILPLREIDPNGGPMRGGWEPSDLTRGGPGDKGVLDFIVPLDVHRDVDTFNKSAELSVTHWRRELNLWRYEGTDRQIDRREGSPRRLC